MKSLLINIGKKSKKAFSNQINSKKKDKILKDYYQLIEKIKGYHSNEIQKILGYVSKSEVVHKDDMVEV